MLRNSLLSIDNLFTLAERYIAMVSQHYME